MRLLIDFLLIGSLSILIGDATEFPDTEVIQKIIRGNQSNLGLKEPNIKLKLSKEIFRNCNVLVLEGTYNKTIKVAVKISDEKEAIEREMRIFKVLNATEDSEIEKKRIPRVYYHGPILDKYFAIVMTLFDETLDERFKQQNKHFSETTHLLIFKQAVEGLNYIHSKNVMHNDITLWNIFIRGEDVFIGDFDRSKLDGNPEEDLEKLLRRIWEMARIPTYEPNAFKIQYLKDPIVRAAFRSILNVEHLCGKKILQIANDAIEKIIKRSGPVQFEWLKKRKNISSDESFRHSKKANSRR